MLELQHAAGGEEEAELELEDVLPMIFDDVLDITWLLLEIRIGRKKAKKSKMIGYAAVATLNSKPS